MRDGIRNNEPWMCEIRKERLLGIDFDIAARHVFGQQKKKKSDESSDDEMKELDMDDDDEIINEPVEAQAVAAATTMARMDNGDYGRAVLPPFGSTIGGPQFFYGYPQP